MHPPRFAKSIASSSYPSSGRSAPPALSSPRRCRVRKVSTAPYTRFPRFVSAWGVSALRLGVVFPPCGSVSIARPLALHQAVNTLRPARCYTWRNNSRPHSALPACGPTVLTTGDNMVPYFHLVAMADNSPSADSYARRVHRTFVQNSAINPFRDAVAEHLVMRGNYVRN